MIANKDKCANQDKTVCDYNEFRRPRYFHGMLLDDNDFRAEQEYHTNKRRFLNRMLYGSGVVCGLGLLGKKEGRWIEVTSGFALDCSGNEIWVPRTIRIDLANLLPPKDKGKNLECEEVEDQKPNTYYIGIRYEEKPSNPVSVYLPSGSCEERTCENSRYKEGFCIEVVPCCLESYKDGLIKDFCKCGEDFPEPKPEDLPLCPSCEGLEDKQLCQCLRLEQFCEQSVSCPECCSCDKPCHVVLGRIEVDEEYRLVSLCINECRRYVLTGRLLQHMFMGVFAGSEEFFSMEVDGQPIDIPNAGELVSNPIKALCFFLGNLLVKGGTFEMLDCDKQKRDREDLGTRVNTMERQFQAFMMKPGAKGTAAQTGTPVTETGKSPAETGKTTADKTAAPTDKPAAPTDKPATPDKPEAAPPKPQKGLPK